MKHLILALVPLLAAAGEQGLLIVHKAGHAVGYYKLDGTHLQSVPIGKHPHELVFSPDHRYAYVTDNGVMRVEHAGKGGNTVSIVDVKARKKAGEIPLGEFWRPHGIAIDPVTGMLLVTTELPDQLLLIDPAKRAIVRRYDTKGQASHMVTLSHDRKIAYVCNAKSGTVAVIELENGRTRLIETGGRPETAVISKDGKRMYVVNLDGDTIDIVELATAKIADRIKTGRGPVRLELSHDERYAVYALIHSDKVEFIDLKARKVVTVIELGTQPVSLNLSPDGKLAYVGLESADEIAVISVPERKMLRRFKTPPGAGPDPIHTISLN